ncbi:MAG: hypothetical protein B7Z38_02910 [Rhodobacterales bacterium 12-64-8]|nr:MAG: hypothetical protein B7Z38_02910 [Rhodobacterales bacterium 12-64-8]OYX49184.1 MAG: hypothetical protein B7Y90_08240 [Alphaproteobacteria bacterium 32-64-14]
MQTVTDVRFPNGLLRCPTTGAALSIDMDGHLLRADGGVSYSFAGEIGRFLEPITEVDGNKATRAFYDNEGWGKHSSGLYQDTAKFVDTRSVSLKFTRACMVRLNNKYFRKGGRYLLDAGCGPIAHDELMSYDAAFEKRVCVDLSVAALAEARRKIGDRGVYLQGDLTNLPIETGSVDAAMCYHVIYQLPEALQAKAFEEIWRVLKPDGVAVVVYWWTNPKLAWRAERVARMFFGKQKRTAAPIAAEPTDASAGRPDHNVMSLDWFTSKKWPFEYSFDTYRTISNTMMRETIPNDWRGALFLKGLMLFQKLFPSYSGKHGEMPAIIIRKAAA